MNNKGLEWLEENSLRAYPLISDSTQYFTSNGIVYDMYQIVLDALLVYSSIPAKVVITNFYTDASNLYIKVSGNITFKILNYATAAYPQYVRNFNSGLDGNLLVVGQLASTLPANSIFLLTNTVFEPGVCLEINPASLGVTDLIIGSLGSLSGNIKLEEGYQFSLIPQDNQIDMEIGRGCGIPLPCQDNFTSLFTSDCNTVCSYINGVTPATTGNPVYIVGDNHVVVFDDPDNNRIFVGFDFDTTDIPTQKLTAPLTL
jgi:hypothetical protein